MTISVRQAASLGPYTIHRKNVTRSGGILDLYPGQSPSGYGDRISTDYVLMFEHEKKPHVQYGGKLRRVYCTIYSNIGSLWIEHGDKLTGTHRWYLSIDASEVLDLPAKTPLARLDQIKQDHIQFLADARDH